MLVAIVVGGKGGSEVEDVNEEVVDNNATIEVEDDVLVATDCSKKDDVAIDAVVDMGKDTVDADAVVISAEKSTKEVIESLFTGIVILSTTTDAAAAKPRLLLHPSPNYCYSQKKTDQSAP